MIRSEDSGTGEQPMSPGSGHLGRSVVLLLFLFCVWLLWSGLYKPLLLGLGALSCLLTFYITRRMGYVDIDVFALRFSYRLIAYWGWLGKEIVLSSIEVARVVLDPKLPISPQIIEIKSTADRAVDQAILGNSITLTPGSLALDVHDGVLKIHTLTGRDADALKSGEMDRRVAALRGS